MSRSRQLSLPVQRATVLATEHTPEHVATRMPPHIQMGPIVRADAAPLAKSLVAPLRAEVGFALWSGALVVVDHVDYLQGRDLRAIAGELPDEFPCVIEAPQSFTVPRLHTHRSSGMGAPVRSQHNPHFLNASYANAALFTPLRNGFAAHTSCVLFRFGAHLQDSGITPGAFASQLEAFLHKLPTRFRVAVQLDDPHYLTLDYARALAQAGASHMHVLHKDHPTLESQRRAVASAPSRIIRVCGIRKRNPKATSFTPYVDHRHRRELATFLRRYNNVPTTIYFDDNFEGAAQLSAFACGLDLAG